MNTALWVVQIILAAIFLISGLVKVTQPRERLVTQMGWVDDYSDGNLRLIGTLEILGAIGLVVPAMTGILPILTPLAALGLAATMVGAVIIHWRRSEYGNIIGNILLLGLALFVTFGRFVAVSL